MIMLDNDNERESGNGDRNIDYNSLDQMYYF